MTRVPRRRISDRFTESVVLAMIVGVGWLAGWVALLTVVGLGIAGE
jgi:hypothetical protein